METGRRLAEFAADRPLDKLIWSGIENHEFRLAYQPIVSFKRRSIHGLEALMRWEHPGLGAVPPSMFIHVAEELDAMAVLGEFAVAEACRRTAELNLTRSPMATLRVSVNVSAAELLDLDFKSVVEAALARSGLAPKHLTLEVSEATLETDVRRVTPLLCALAEAGIRLSVDGFATGGAGLGYLARVPLHEAKIGRSLTAGIATDKRAAHLVGGLVRLVHGLGMTVVAEGIEDAKEAATMRALGADYGQGFFFARPVETPDLVRVLARV